MATKKNYSRYFIILQEDEKGFSTDVNKFPTGYTKIEKKNDKCKVSYYVQNLKKDKEPYYMVLICSDKDVKKLIKLGKMNLDDFGSAEISYEYDVSNLANSGIGMDKIKGACIVSFKDGNMRAALIGFINGAKLDSWKSYAIVEPKQKFRNSEMDKDINKDVKLNDDKSLELKEKKVEVKEEREVEEKTEIRGDEKEVKEVKEGREATEATQKEMEAEIELNRSLSENNAFDEYEKDIEKFKNINKEVEDVEEIKKDESKLSEETDLNREQDLRKQLFIEDEKEDLKDDSDKEKDNSCEQDYVEVEEKSRKVEERNKKEKDKCKEKEYKVKKEKEYKEKECKEHKEDYPVGAMEEFFKKLAKELEEVHDACPEIGKCKWYKIPVEQLEKINHSIDCRTYNMLYCPMTYYYPYIKKHGHYLIGYKCDSKGNMKYIVYAIPGTKMVYDQPFGGTTGFTTWTCRELGNNKMCSMGYWVMFYDFKNCRVMVPVI